MTKFKVGDKVIREDYHVDGKFWRCYCSINSMNPEGVFEVTDIDDNSLQLKGMVDQQGDGVEFDPCLFNLYIEGINAKEPTASYCEVCTERFSQCRCFETKGLVKISDDGVKSPSHYMLFDDIEAIEIIARTMSVEQFKGYCLGNILKYRLRAGKKSELATLEKDLAKADFYKELFDKHKSKCYAKPTSATTKELKD